MKNLSKTLKEDSYTFENSKVSSQPSPKGKIYNLKATKVQRKSEKVLVNKGTNSIHYSK